jgi:hypothetical protein
MTQPNALANSPENQMARPLNVLVPLIKEDLKRAREAGLPYYRAAGEKLLEARSQLQHGEFLSWVQHYFGVGIRQADRYMKLAKLDAGVQFESLSAATDSPRESHQPKWHEAARKVINRVDTHRLNLHRAGVGRAEERAAQRDLALKLIDIGYKVLARKLHPDHGGSRDAMARLNAVRTRLKQHA